MNKAGYHFVYGNQELFHFVYLTAIDHCFGCGLDSYSLCCLGGTILRR